MVLFFFYHFFTNIDSIKQINTNFEITDGYAIVESYNKEGNVLQISDEIVKNNTALYGKIVTFNLEFDDVIQKINSIAGCNVTNKYSNYILDTIWVTKIHGGLCKAYIIY